MLRIVVATLVCHCMYAYPCHMYINVLCIYAHLTQVRHKYDFRFNVVKLSLSALFAQEQTSTTENMGQLEHVLLLIVTVHPNRFSSRRLIQQ